MSASASAEWDCLEDQAKGIQEEVEKFGTDETDIEVDSGCSQMMLRLDPSERNDKERMGVPDSEATHAVGPRSRSR